MEVSTLSPIPWHPAFVQALQLELEAFLGSLSFQSEVPLTAEPLRIDSIVKNPSSLPIDKNIARIFRGTNIFEYKSPLDSLSIHGLHKTIGYAFLYASLRQADIADMTVSVIGSRHPRELLKELREKGPGRVVERERGIYEVEGYPLPVQIIESGKLGTEENLWLRGLRPGLKNEVIKEIMEEGGKRDGSRVGAYLYAVLESNLEEVLEMVKQKKLTLSEALEKAGLAAEWEARGRAQGEARGAAWAEKATWGKVIGLLKQGYTVEQLEQMEPPDGAPLPTNS